MKLSLIAMLASSAAASINSIAVPTTIAADQPIVFKLVNNIDQSTTYQTSITFGLGAQPAHGDSLLGQPVSSIYLQDGNGPPPAPFTRTMSYSHNRFAGSGRTEIRAAVFGVYGVSGVFGTAVFKANVTIGSVVSDEYVELERIV